MSRLRTSAAWLSLAVLALPVALSVSAKTPTGEGAPAPQGIDSETRIDVNNIDMFVTNKGSFAFELLTGDPGFIYPKGTNKTAIFASGLWLGANVPGDSAGASPRIAVGEYSQEYAPGYMDATGHPVDYSGNEFRVYKVDKTDPDYRESRDYVEWPADQGAPVDENGDPLLIGDQTLWCVYNDADTTQHTNTAGATNPLGIEVQQTTFAFDRTGPLGNTVFLKFRMINKGPNILDSTFVSVWSDPDLGGYTDDLVGSDTLLSMGYCYNATNNDELYGLRPPAVGYDFLQGPIVPSPGDTAHVSGRPVPDYRNLPMTSFNKYINGTDPSRNTETYNYMKGLTIDGEDLINEVTGERTLYMMSGDPVTGTGWLDSNPADRRFMLSSGPFTMAPGDTQEVVVGIVIAQGADRLSSVTLMKIYDEKVQEAYDVNFDLPAPPPRPVVHPREYDQAIDLVWDPYFDAEGNIYRPVETNERLDVRYVFQGYNVWQGESVSGPWKKIITFDVDDSFSTVYTDQVNEDLGALERQLVETGKDNGLAYHFRVDQDYIKGGPLDNFRDYYFAVTAYSVETRHVSDYISDGRLLGKVALTLENSQAALQLMPKASAAVLEQFADHVAGVSDGVVRADYVRQDEINDHEYRVTFAANADTSDNADYPFVWDFTDLTADSVIFADQRMQSEDYARPTVDGFILQVLGPSLAVKDWSWIGGTRWLTWVDWGGSGFNGGIGIGSEFFDSNLSPGDYSKDVEIRFSNNEADWSYCQTYRRDLGYAVGGIGTFPGSAWDVTDPANPRRLNINFVENQVLDDPSTPEDESKLANLKWDPNNSDEGGREYLFIMNSNYSATATHSDYNAENDGTSTDVLIAGWLALRGDHPLLESNDTFLIRLNRVNVADDIFEFTTKRIGEATGTVIDNDLSKVKAVPNPYFNQSAYELNQFDRVLRFINLPNAPATVRIFNLAGDLVRTLHKEDRETAYVTWDLHNEYGIPVASGIYLYHVEAKVEGVLKTSTGKLAVFVEKERLDRF